MSQKIVQFALAADLVGGGSVAVNYPAGTAKGNFFGSMKHKLATASGNIFPCPDYFTLSYSATQATINWTAGSPTIPTGTVVLLQLDMPGFSAQVEKYPIPAPVSIFRAATMSVNFGSPAAAVTTAVCAAQAVAGAAALLINGTLANLGVANLDVPRNLQVVSSVVGDTTQTITVTGKDIYGSVMVESVALNGTTIVPMNKAFVSITAAKSSAALAGTISIGTSVKFGLPMFLPSSAYVLKEIVDAGAVTTGTFTGGAFTNPSAVTLDVRGLYAPATAPDGVHTYEVILALTDAEFKGHAQFAG